MLVIVVTEVIVPVTVEAMKASKVRDSIVDCGARLSSEAVKVMAVNRERVRTEFEKKK